MTVRPAGSADRPPRATRADGWPSFVPLALVMIALVALVTLPVLGERYAEPLNREVRDVVEPARALATDIHVALALETTMLHDYLETRSPELLERYRDAYRGELGAYERLAVLTGRLGPAVQQRFADVRRLERQWHEAVERFLSDSTRSGRTPTALPFREDLYEDLLLATAGLDEALSRASQFRRRQINDADRTRRRLTVALAIIAFSAALGVAWLERRVRIFAREAERRRAEVERATESRARLMRGVSHDLKNPLGAIDGHAALLETGLKGTLTPEQQHSVARIRRSVRSLLTLIGDLLDLSKAEAGQLAVHPQPTDLGDVVRDTAEEHRAAAEAAGHSLQVEIDAALPVILTDAARVRQILGNLLSNAVKYTPAGGRIVVRAQARTSDGGGSVGRWTVIDVIDTGPGIPEDKLETIFEEFSRLHEGVTPGAGLGLTIARRIAVLLGGEVVASSQLGRGATFTLSLPVEARKE